MQHPNNPLKQVFYGFRNVAAAANKDSIVILISKIALVKVKNETGNHVCDKFGLQLSLPSKPIEPLYSMLHSAPLDSVEYLHENLSKIENDDQLNDIVPKLGITPSYAIEQSGG